jgi:anti-anti-sigma factor
LSHGHPLLEVVEMRDAGRVRVLMRGELDRATAPLMTETLRRLGARGERVLLDLDELAFIDMGGLRAVLAAVADASNDGWSLALTTGSRPVRRLFGMVGVDGQLPTDRTSP